MNKVALFGCDEYQFDKVFDAVKKSVDALGGIQSFVKKDQLVVLKVNLVIKFAPERAATTHPLVVAAISRLCQEAGAKVVIADSAGGPFNDKYMGAIYKATGMVDASLQYGFEICNNYNSYTAKFDDAKVAKEFEIMEILQKADVIINVCKLKSHSFTGITNGVKNMFGAIPGLQKVQMHGKYQTLENFSNMLYDIWGYFGNKLALTISDAVIGMEGEGPTNGNPRKIGAIMASTNPVAIDVVGAQIMNVDPNTMPTISVGIKRGYLQNANDFEIVGDKLDGFVLKDFDKRIPNMYTPFSTTVPKWFQPILHNLTTQRPSVHKNKCLGCATCARHCPVGAICMETRKNGKKYAKFDYTKCIRCFCCQELCPFGIVKVKTGVLYRFLKKTKKK
ncbi:MAG: DUF362 domain-containing protein [Clostridia bacterium]|nr:DUF362 domain-containing protein [Clostridia bacterium]